MEAAPRARKTTPLAPWALGGLLFCATVLLTPVTFAREVDDAPPPKKSLADEFDDAIGKINKVLGAALFTNITGDTFQADVLEDGRPILDESGRKKTRTVPVPLVVALLAFCGVVFTFFHGFVNVRGFRHAISIVRGKYESSEHEGEVSHFRALTSALSATVGLGNIAGVAIAIQLGGPGAVFWMLIAAFFGMSVKFTSCTLAQLYRQKNVDGSVSGGAMYYLDLGLRARGGPWIKVGKALGILYACMIMGGAMGGGNMFQSNQAFEAVSSSFGVSKDYGWIFGLIMACSVGVVVLGGIQRIGAATARIVPAMVAIYLVASVGVLFTNASAIPAALVLIVERAFSENAAFGGAVGVMVWGVQRASFSNEAGLGSSAIAHAAAKTNEPVREGLVAMMEPFIDTIIVCTMTALVVIVSGAWNDPSIPKEQGVALTNAAFATVFPWFPKILAVCVILFAYSTMISWCYYGERGWIYLMDHFGLGIKTLPLFRIVFLCFVFTGAVANLGAVLTFSDILILCMAFPNLTGSALLLPEVRTRLRDYFKRMNEAGQPA